MQQIVTFPKSTNGEEEKVFVPFISYKSKTEEENNAAASWLYVPYPPSLRKEFF